MPPDPDAERADGLDLDVGLGVAAVARRLGIAAATLRTWDRRYGVGPTGHQAGAHRRYTSADLARLTLMRRLMLEGVSPADAARAALDAPEDVAAREIVLSAHARHGVGRPAARRRSAGRSGGGRVVALRDASPAARGLARAAMSLDAQACTAAIATGVSRTGVVRTWNELVLPVLTGVGERWRITGSGVEVEHLLSEAAEDALRQVTRRLTKPVNPRPVLVAALESEDHRLPLHAVAAALAERHIAVRMLGPRLPIQALADAVTRTGAGAVFLWSQGAGGQLAPHLLLPVPAVRPAPALVLGGRGWVADQLPPGMTWVPDLGAAVLAVAAALGVGVAGPDPR